MNTCKLATIIQFISGRQITCLGPRCPVWIRIGFGMTKKRILEVSCALVMCYSRVNVFRGRVLTWITANVLPTVNYIFSLVNSYIIDIHPRWKD